MSYSKRLVLNTLTFLALAVLFPTHIYVRSLWAAILASMILSLLNALVKPILVLFSFPLTLLTFGLFSFVVNGMMLSLTAKFVGMHNFGFSSFSWAIIASLGLSFVNMVFSEHELKTRL